MGSSAQLPGVPITPSPQGPSRLAAHVRNYAWGSRHAIATLQGREAPTLPEAELWFGAHEAGPATLEHPGGDVPLDAAIAADPDALLGPDTAARFGGRLPFLLKLLAAARPLSIQVHPDAAAAASGFAAEERAAVPRRHPDRCFPDPWPKPELLRAVTPFAALCGFRAVERTLDLLDDLTLPGAGWVEQALREGGDAALPQVVERLLRLATAPRRELLEGLRGALAPTGGQRPAWGRTREHIAALHATYPDDPGVLVALLLELHELSPGQALEVAPGTPHAYLGGVGVEVMAASDNVLRGGLTTKRVDTHGFVAALDPGAMPVGRTRTHQIGPGHHRHATGSPYFALHEYRDAPDATASHRLDPASAAIVLCLEGQVTLSHAETTAALTAGYAAFLPARATPCRLHVEGTAIVATAGDHHLDGYPMGV